MASFSVSLPCNITSPKSEHLQKKRLCGRQPPSSPLVRHIKYSSVKCCNEPPRNHFHSTVWDVDQLLALSSSSTDATLVMEEKLEQLKKEVERMLMVSLDPFHELDLINTIQRLGVAYHFEDEIEHILDHMYNAGTHFLLGADLYFTSLWFRLLRQAGYYVPTDVFNKFKDEKGELQANLVTDVEGMLSFYEASYYGINGEEIMDEALAFTTRHLNSMLPHLSPALAQEVGYALKLPIQQSVERVQARQYISIYQQAKSPNQTLLEFAKLDFNALQLLYRKELSEVTRWYNQLDIKSKLPFETRDRIVESYVITSSIFFEPQFSLGRIHLAKMWAVLTVVDDAFDTYGKLDELDPLCHAFLRWSAKDVSDLSEPMKVVFFFVHDFVREIEGDMIKTGHNNGVPYLIKEIQDFVKAQFQEAKILFSKNVPALEMWYPISLATVGFGPFLVNATMHMGDIATKEVFNWISKRPKMLECNYMIARIMDDIGAPKDERGTIISNVTCYMKEHGVSEYEATKCLKNMLPSIWKDMNEESFNPNPLPRCTFKIIFNMSRIMTNFYSGEVDGYTNSGGHTKEMVTSLIVNPIPT